MTPLNDKDYQLSYKDTDSFFFLLKNIFLNFILM